MVANDVKAQMTNAGEWKGGKIAEEKGWGIHRGATKGINSLILIHIIRVDMTGAWPIAASPSPWLFAC